jgi:hypothetical protein
VAFLVPEEAEASRAAEEAEAFPEVRLAFLMEAVNLPPWSADQSADR